MNEHRKPYGKKTTEEDLIEACGILCDRINYERNSRDFLNIQYENFRKIWQDIEKGKRKGWYEEYRRLYKKCRRLKIETEGTFKGARK